MSLVFFFLFVFIYPDGQVPEGDKGYWPTQSALTTRLRRLITTFQRTSKFRQIQQIPPMFPIHATVTQAPYEDASLNPKVAAKIERQQRLATSFYYMIEVKVHFQ